MSSEEDIYTKVFGKEHSGRVRGMGFGVCPSQLFEPTYRYGSSSNTSSFGAATSSEYDKLRSDLEASNARVQALELEVAKVRALEAQMTYIMQNFGGQMPPRFNQVRNFRKIVNSQIKPFKV